MHCYRVTTFRPSDPVYILVGMQAEAFALARDATNASRSPVVALIDLPTDKARFVDALNDPQRFIGDSPSLKAWEFVQHGSSAFKHEIEPNSGERKSEARMIERRKAAALAAPKPELLPGEKVDLSKRAKDANKPAWPFCTKK